MFLETKRKIIISFLVFILLLSAHTTHAAQWVVVRVIDGDTVKAKSLSKEIIIRLVGIDAPETGKKKHEPGQPYSRKARD
jgi:endonuclease YncB( thermonuclease family)